MLSKDFMKKMTLSHEPNCVYPEDKTANTSDHYELAVNRGD